MKRLIMLFILGIMFSTQVSSQDLSTQLEAYVASDPFTPPQIVWADIYFGYDDVSTLEIWFVDDPGNIISFNSPWNEVRKEGLRQFYFDNYTGEAVLSFMEYHNDWFLAGVFLRYEGKEFVCVTNISYLNFVETWR